MRRPLVMLALAAACAAPPAAGQGAAPGQVQEETALGFVRAVESGDPERVWTYMRERFAPDLLARRPEEAWRRMAGMLAERHVGLDVGVIEVPGPEEVVVGVESPRGVVTFAFAFESAAPDRIAGLSLRAGGAGPELDLPPLAPPPGGQATFAQTLDAWLDELERRGLFSGAVLVTRGGEPLYRGARGLASRRWQVPNTVATRFDVGSINKSFTRVAVARLLAEGRLALDDTLARHLPDFPDPEKAAKIRVRHLLEHSSGLGGLFGPEFARTSKALFREPRDYLELIARQPLAFEPGEGSEYSNSGYIVLGAVVEAAAGEPFVDYVARHVFAAAGMADTGFFDRDDPVPGVAEGYTCRGAPGGRCRSNVYELPARGNPAGSAQSTVADLVAFDRALRGGRLLPPGWTGWVLGGPLPAGEEGRGGEEAPDLAGVGYGIAGGGPGVSAVLEVEGELAVAVLANIDPPIAEAMARALLPVARAAAAGG